VRESQSNRYFPGKTKGREKGNHARPKDEKNRCWQKTRSGEGNEAPGIAKKLDKV